MIEINIKKDDSNRIPDDTQKATLGYIRMLCYEAKIQENKLVITDNLLKKYDFRLLDTYKEENYDETYYFDFEPYLNENNNFNGFVVMDKYKNYRFYPSNKITPCEEEEHAGVKRKRKIERESIIVVPFISETLKNSIISNYKNYNIRTYYDDFETQPNIIIKGQVDFEKMNNATEIFNSEILGIYEISNVKFKKELNENAYRIPKEYKYVVNLSSPTNIFEDVNVDISKNEVFDVYVKEDVEIDGVKCTIEFDIIKDNVLVNSENNYKFENIKIGDVCLFNGDRFSETNIYEKNLYATDGFIYVIENIETTYEKNTTTKKIKATLKHYDKKTKSFEDLPILPIFFDSNARFICDYNTEDVILREVKKKDEIEKGLNMKIKNFKTLNKFMKEGFDINTNVLIQTNSFIKKARIKSIEFNPFNYNENINIDFFSDLFTLSNVNKVNVKTDIAQETNRVRKEYTQADDRLNRKITRLNGNLKGLGDKVDENIDLETFRNIQKCEAHFVDYERQNTTIIEMAYHMQLLTHILIRTMEKNKMEIDQELLEFYNYDFFKNPIDHISLLARNELEYVRGLKETFEESFALDTVYEQKVDEVLKWYI